MANQTPQDIRNLVLAREAEAAFDEMRFSVLPGDQPTLEQQKYFDAAQKALADLITLLEGKPIETYYLKADGATTGK